VDSTRHEPEGKQRRHVPPIPPPPKKKVKNKRNNKIRKKKMPRYCALLALPQKMTFWIRAWFNALPIFGIQKEELSTIYEKKKKEREREIRNSKPKIWVYIFHRKYLRRSSTCYSAMKFNVLRIIKLLVGVTFMLKVVILGVSTHCSLKNCDVENLKKTFFKEIAW